MTAALPPHFLHRRTSSRKTRFINSAQESLLSRRLAGSPGATSIVGTVDCCEQCAPLALSSGGSSVRDLLSAFAGDNPLGDFGPSRLKTLFLGSVSRPRFYADEHSVVSCVCSSSAPHAVARAVVRKASAIRGIKIERRAYRQSDDLGPRDGFKARKLKVPTCGDCFRIRAKMKSHVPRIDLVPGSDEVGRIRHGARWGP